MSLSLSSYNDFYQSYRHLYQLNLFSYTEVSMGSTRTCDRMHWQFNSKLITWFQHSNREFHCYFYLFSWLSINGELFLFCFLRPRRKSASHTKTQKKIIIPFNNSIISKWIHKKKGLALTVCLDGLIHGLISCLMLVSKEGQN